MAKHKQLSSLFSAFTTRSMHLSVDFAKVINPFNTLYHTMSSPTTTSLLGPPEIHRSHHLNPPSTLVSNPNPPMGYTYTENMTSSTYLTTDHPNPPMGYTENMSPTYLSSGNPCLDFFFHIVPDTPRETLVKRLAESWKHDPLTTLKLICNLRGVRGTGKSDRKGYYTAALWLHKNHPKTLAYNAASLVEFGYFKDLPEILFKLLGGPDLRKKVKSRHRPMRFNGHQSCTHTWKPYKPKTETRTRVRIRRVRSKIDLEIKKCVPREQRILAEKKRVEAEIAKARNIRHGKRILMAKKVIEQYNRDPDYKYLHDCVSDLFSECLRSDIKLLEKGEIRNISLAAKWCPSLNTSFDRSTLLCESIAKKIFPRHEYPEYNGVEEAHYAYRVRDRLRKQILVPLRKALELPEVYIGQNQWGLIQYNRVASVAMILYKKLFLEYDKSRFMEYLDNVRSGKSKIAAGALLPHEIIACFKYYDYDEYSDVEYDDDGVDHEVAELQWKRMVDDMAKKGKLKNCLAICDVSGSMYGEPMNVCVALGLLVSELSEEPWKGKVITFSQNPKLHMIKGDDLKSKNEFVRRMEWGANTDFQKVFDLILEVAIKAKLSKEDMIKRVFVFSDMEFDQASEKPWETDYEVIKKKFNEKGYGESVPEIVFWNLRDSRSTPVAGKENGVALVSGFSKNMMKLFMDDDGGMNAQRVMEKAISGEEYKKLVVID